MITKYITYNQLNTKELGLRLVDEIELENFLEDTVPLMSESNIRLAIFPIDEKTETIIFDPIEFAKMINDYFYEWYGEEFDLPYLLGG